MGESGVQLLITVPVCSFRKGFAREYLETEEVPPPSTIYGFLLSLVGEEDRKVYLGTKIAYALVTEPEVSVVLRTIWRVKVKESPPGVGSNRRPDYQEILTELSLGVWVAHGELAERVRVAGSKASEINRFGGLSLGESRDMVNDIIWFPDWPVNQGRWVVACHDGDLALPVWVDHVGSKGTIWRQFRLEVKSLDVPGNGDPRWIEIAGPHCP